MKLRLRAYDEASSLMRKTVGMSMLIRQVQLVKDKPKKDRSGKPLKSWER